MIDKDTDFRRRFYILHGMYDREIAELEGVTRETIKSWRIVRGIPPNQIRHDEYAQCLYSFLLRGGYYGT